MTMPMVSLTLPIYRKKYKAMRHEAELMRDAARFSSEDLTNNLRVSFQQTLQNLYDADRRVKLYTDQAMLADKSVQLLITSFSASSADFVEVLRMQQQLLDYQFKLVEAVVDKNTSIARVVYLTGN
jgi:outer membrane protein TolC